MDRLSAVFFDLAKSLQESVQGKNGRKDAASDIICIYIYCGGVKLSGDLNIEQPTHL